MMHNESLGSKKSGNLILANTLIQTPGCLTGANDLL